MSEAAPAPAAPAAPPAGTQPPPAEAAEGVDTAQNTAEQAPATAPEGEKPDTGQDPEKRRESRRFERRLDKAYKRAAEAQARADLLEKQLNEFRTTQQAVNKPADPAAPKLEQFSDIEEYARALAKHESDKAVREFQSRQQGETQKQYNARIAEGWESKAERGGGKYEDFDEVVGDIKPTTPWAMALMEADNGDEIAYYLGKNMKEAERIAKLPPLSQIREIGRLEAKLAAEPPKPKTPSKAPAPIEPLKGAAPVVTDIPSDGDDIGAWIKKRSKQVHGARK